MKMEECRVKITSREEFDKVSKICLANGAKWLDGDDNYNDIDSDYKLIHIYDYGGIMYDSRDNYDDDTLMSYHDFINKYGKHEKKQKIEDCIIKTTSKEEFRRVEEICFKNDIGWVFSSNKHNDYFLKDITHLYIDDNILSYGTHDSDYALNESKMNNRPIYSFNEFTHKYDNYAGGKWLDKQTIKIKSLLKIKTVEPVKLNDSLYKQQKIKLNQDNNVNFGKVDKNI